MLDPPGAVKKHWATDMEPRRTRPLLPFAGAVTLWAPCPVGAEPIPDPPPGIQYVIETDNHIYPIGENVLAVQKVVRPSPWKFTLALNMTPGFDLWVLEDGVTIWAQHTCFFLYGSCRW